ncbi:hypothetical protein QP178_19845 [Sphingomonas aurantiaca]|uniref:hypothetical protein n=1 Tax=Sphingomonas aurantiaca TaxID=185949 RepID=UPI002FE1F125
MLDVVRRQECLPAAWLNDGMPDHIGRTPPLLHLPSIQFAIPLPEDDSTITKSWRWGCAFVVCEPVVGMAVRNRRGGPTGCRYVPSPPRLSAPRVRDRAHCGPAQSSVYAVVARLLNQLGAFDEAIVVLIAPGAGAFGCADWLALSAGQFTRDLGGSTSAVCREEFG